MSKPAIPVRNKKTPFVWVLLAVPYLALCFPQLYARATPAFLGFPFFYWYQFLWVVLTSSILGVVYHRVKEPEASSKHR